MSIDSTVGPSDTMHYLAGYRLRNVTVAPTGDTAEHFTLYIHQLHPGVYILRLTSAAGATSLINKVLIE